MQETHSSRISRLLVAIIPGKIVVHRMAHWDFGMSEHGTRLVFTSVIDGGISIVLGPSVNGSDIREALASMLRRWPAAFSIHRKWASEGAVRPIIHDQARVDVWIIPHSCVDMFDQNPEGYADSVPSIQGLALGNEESANIVLGFWNGSI